METAAGLVGGIVKLSSGMERCKYQPFCRHTFLMHSHRNSTPIVRNGTGSVLFQKYIDGIAVSRKMLVHRIVYDLVDQVIQSFARCASYIHTRTLADCLQAFQHRNTAGVICLIFSHCLLLLSFLYFSLNNCGFPFRSCLYS